MQGTSRVGIGLASFWLSTVVANAVLTIDVGAVQLQPDMANQSLDFFIQNNSSSPVGSIFGLNFRAQVDGGAAGPKIMPDPTGIQLYAGTSLFDSFTANQVDQGSDSWTVFYGIDTGGNGVSVPASSSTLLARITFDTTGLHPGDGPWTLSFDGIAIG